MAVMHDASTEVKRVLTLIAQRIVDEPAQVLVESESLANETVIRLRVAPQDLPVMLDNNENVGHSLRNLLAEMGVKHKQQFALNIAATDSRS